jgi:hypothetical protein
MGFKKINYSLSILLFFLFTWNNNTLAQSSIDSLKIQFNKETSDSNKSSILAYLALEYRNSNVDSSIKFANQGIKYATKSHFLKGELMNGYILGESHRIKGNYAKALDISLTILKKSDAAENNDMQFNLYNLIATIYGSMADNEKYSFYLHKMLTLSRKNNISEESLNVLYTNLGDVFEKLNVLDSARFYTHLAYDISVKLIDNQGIGLTLNNLGNIHLKLNQPEVAFANYKMSLPYVSDIDDAVTYCEATIGISKIYEMKKMRDSSLFYADKSFQVAKRTGFSQYILNASTFLANYYRNINKIDSSYKYLMEINIAKDSLFSQEKLKQIQVLELQETLRQREIEEARIQEDIERKNNIQYAIIAISIITILVIFLLLSNSIIVSDSVIKFLGVMSLLLIFEFINLISHPFISKITHHSPIMILIISVSIAAIIIPIHHQLEHRLIEKLLEKNKKIRDRRNFR